MSIWRKILILTRKNLSFRLGTVILFLSFLIFIFGACWFLSELLSFLTIPILVLAFFIFNNENNNKPLDFEPSLGIKACCTLLAIGGVLGGVMFFIGFLGFFISIFLSHGNLIVIETTPLLAEKAQYLLGSKEVPRLLYLVIKGCLPLALTGISLLLITVWGVPNIKNNHKRKPAIHVK